MPATLNYPLAFVSGLGMMLVAVVAVYLWKRTSHAQARWFWIGAGLWFVAVAIKIGVALALNPPVVKWLDSQLERVPFLAAVGLFAGVESSICEIGLTLLAVVIWRSLGRNAGRAIAVGVGAGAFEAFILGVAGVVVVALSMTSLPEMDAIRRQIAEAQNSVPLFWLISPIERVLAILVHAASRALVLLGFVQRRWGMILGGFAIFTAIDGLAGATQASGKMGTFSPWWIELAVLPFAAISVPILRWCYRNWREPTGESLQIATAD